MTDPKTIRDSWVKINDLLHQLQQLYPTVQIEFVNCGVAPGDGCGDTVHIAQIKVLTNILKILTEGEPK